MIKFETWRVRFIHVVYLLYVRGEVYKWWRLTNKDLRYLWHHIYFLTSFYYIVIRLTTEIRDRSSVTTEIIRNILFLRISIVAGIANNVLVFR